MTMALAIALLSMSLALVAMAALVPAAFGDRFLAPPADAEASDAPDSEGENAGATSLMSEADLSPGFDDRQMSFVRRSPVRTSRHTISCDYDARGGETYAAPTCYSARAQTNVNMGARAVTS